MTIDGRTDQTFAGFCDLTLAKSEWTHEAHLRVCWASLDTRTTAETIEFLRGAISSYNVATGVANTSTSGYHETLTHYFVAAVASLTDDSIDTVLCSPRCQVSAPMRHWSREVLFGREARAHWVDPDLTPLGESFGV